MTKINNWHCVKTDHNLCSYCEPSNQLAHLHSDDFAFYTLFFFQDSKILMPNVWTDCTDMQADLSIVHKIPFHMMPINLRLKFGHNKCKQDLSTDRIASLTVPCLSLKKGP